MAISRGMHCTVGGQPPTVNLSTQLSTNGAVAGQLAIASIVTAGGIGGISWPAGWSVLVNQMMAQSPGNYCSVATKVLTSADISGSEIMSGSGGDYIAVTLATYSGLAPKVDAASVAYTAISTSSNYVTSLNVSSTPSSAGEWLIGILMGTSSIASASVTGSDTLNDWFGLTNVGNGLYHFDSNGPITSGAVTETFAASTSQLCGGLLMYINDFVPGFFAMF